MRIHEVIYDLSFDEIDRTMDRLIEKSDMQITLNEAGPSNPSQYCFYFGENVYGFLESCFRRINFRHRRGWVHIIQSDTYSYMGIPIRKRSGVNLYDNAISLEKIHTNHPFVLPYYSISDHRTVTLGSPLTKKEQAINFIFHIEKVIFNDPATIVLWSDGTKTVVKAENEPFDPEKGLAMAISKKHFGNTGRYFEEFKKWINKDKDGERK